jgi:hypothetical protein
LPCGCGFILKTNLFIQFIFSQIKLFIHAMCANRRIAVGHDRWRRARLSSMELEMKRTFQSMHAFATTARAKLLKGKFLTLFLNLNL